MNSVTLTVISDALNAKREALGEYRRLVEKMPNLRRISQLKQGIKVLGHLQFTAGMNVKQNKRSEKLLAMKAELRRLEKHRNDYMSHKPDIESQMIDDIRALEVDFYDLNKAAKA